jgi:hypothetical protein
MRVANFEIVNHGPEHPQYFQGQGVAHTSFDYAFTGVGDNAKEAYEDAVDSAVQVGFDPNDFPMNPRGIRRTDALTEDEREAEWVYYVSVLVAESVFSLSA